MKLGYIAHASIVAFALLAACGSANGQKSRDTLRIGINSPFTALSPYHASLDEANFFYGRIYESLLTRDEHAGKWAPLLATSWKRVDNVTLEFTLAENVRFHNGNVFDADDVVGTIEYIADPKVTLTNKDRYSWVKRVEKLGPHTVRLTANEPMAIDLALIAYRFSIFDKESMDKLSDKTEYGRLSPVGTGAYKAIDIDRNRGVTVERYENFAGDKRYARAPAARVHGLFMPDRQTQIAQLITDGLDIVRDVEPDQAEDLKRHKNVDITVMPAASMVYLALDASGGGGNKALTDPRVREAIFSAIDRKAIAKHLIPDGENAKTLNAFCFDDMIACKYSKKAADYDPARAKKLLAEAGYPDGFELEYDVFTPTKDIGTAIAGDLLKIGVRGKISPMTLQIYRKKQSEISMQAWTFSSPLGTFPDAYYALGLWFQGTRAGYFNTDPVVMGAVDDGVKELDPTKRDEIYRRAFDRINEMHYLLPIASVPTVYAHSSAVRVLENQRSVSFSNVSDFEFK